MFLKRMPLKCKNMAEQDIKENEMTPVSSVDYVRGLKGKDSVLIKKSDLIKLIADSLLIREPISISTKIGIEVDTGILGTHIVSIFYISGGLSDYEHVISISKDNEVYKTETLVSCWFSKRIVTTVRDARLFIIQNVWESMILYFKVLR